MAPHPPRTPVAVLFTLCALALASCGDTIQDEPIGASPLEAVMVKSHFPVYWLGLSFGGLQVTGVYEDPGGAITIHYGDCLVGGQYTCVRPLSIVTSPDNSFLPGGATTAQAIAIRGVPATLAQSATTLAIPTGGVVVNIYAQRAVLARYAAHMMAPLNDVGLPEMGLPKALPDTGFDRLPLQSQVPPDASVAPAPRRQLSRAAAGRRSSHASARTGGRHRR